MKLPALLNILVVLLIAGACKKESFITGRDALVSISSDTIHFDTLFTSTGSVTHFFKVVNENDQKLKVSEIALAGGGGSYYKINADGSEGPTVNDLEIAANDSLYVFVTVKVDPDDAKLPFVVQDSVRISFNGNEKWVQLQAWGQNANFFREKIITSDTTWRNEKPYVILGGILVAPGVTLSIEQGTKIYLHADAPFIVDGSLVATGKKYDSTKVVFAGDRLDEFYRDLPASWPGIYFRETSTNNVFTHVILKNAYQGIVAEKPAATSEPKVTLKETVIDNCFDVGILAVASSVDAVNCVVSNCGRNIILAKGGDYHFTHVTDVAVNNSYISHREPVLTVTDFIKTGDVLETGDMNASFVNCIFWGNNGTVENEVLSAREGQGAYTVDFKNCLWKVSKDPEDITESAIINGQDPLFRTIDTRSNLYNFRLKEGSPAINSGAMTAFSTDLDGNIRSNIPDIGAFETTF